MLRMSPSRASEGADVRGRTQQPNRWFGAYRDGHAGKSYELAKLARAPDPADRTSMLTRRPSHAQLLAERDDESTS